MHELPPGAFDNFTKGISPMTSILGHQIPPAFQGPVFKEGEIIEIRGGLFEVHKIIAKGLVLHGIPSAGNPEKET